MLVRNLFTDDLIYLVFDSVYVCLGYNENILQHVSAAQRRDGEVRVSAAVGGSQNRKVKRNNNGCFHRRREMSAAKWMRRIISSVKLIGCIYRVRFNWMLRIAYGIISSIACILV